MNENTLQNTEIKDLKETQRNLVGRNEFEMWKWIFGILITLSAGCFAYLFNQISTMKVQIETYNTEVVRQLGTMNTTMAIIKTDLDWVKRTLQGSEITNNNQ